MYLRYGYGFSDECVFVLNILPSESSEQLVN